MEKISFVIPCYNSESTLENVVHEVVSEMKTSLPENEYEIILVNDCSKDGTTGVIRKLCDELPNVKGIEFAKNFGQHAALLAGFRKLSGDYVVCLDDDGQMPIESVKEMIDTLRDGADCVVGRYSKTKQSLFRRFGSRLNSKMNEILLSKPKDLELNSFWGAKRFVTDEMIKYEGAYPYIGGLLLRTTSNIRNIDVKHRARASGKSGYSLFKLINLWMNGFTAFSEKPLRIATFCGFIFAIAGFIFAVISVIRKLIDPSILLGYTSSICIVLFVGGIIMIILGVTGEYIGRTYICINHSPQYVIRSEYSSEASDRQEQESDKADGEPRKE